LAKDAPSHFIRDYYNGLARRYLKHAENQEEIARTSESFAVTEIIPDGPGVQAAPESSPEEDGPAPPTPLQPAQEPTDGSQPSRRRRPARGPRRARKAMSSKTLREN
jgi:hypothetical protein